MVTGKHTAPVPSILINPISIGLLTLICKGNDAILSFNLRINYLNKQN